MPDRSGYPMTHDNETLFAARIGHNPEAKSIHELRQKNLSPDERKTDVSATHLVFARQRERDERARTKRDYKE